MKNFVLGVIVGVVIALCGYKPYQIEMELLHGCRSLRLAPET